jgi:hypothetical protein
MEGELEPRWQTDPGRLRISDTDRHQVAEILRQAAGEGRIDLSELDERLEAAYAARTYADLVPLTADLPVRGPVPRPAPRPRPAGPTGPVGPLVRHDSTIAVLGGASRKGAWELGATHTAFAMMAGIDLDLREARFTQRETVIYANAFWAGIDIVVNEFTHVIVDGVGILGGFDHARDKVPPALGPDSPTVRVKGVALMAGVTVQRRPMPGPRRRSLYRRR